MKRRYVLLVGCGPYGCDPIEWSRFATHYMERNDAATVARARLTHWSTALLETQATVNATQQVQPIQREHK